MGLGNVLLVEAEARFFFIKAMLRAGRDVWAIDGAKIIDTNNRNSNMSHCFR